MATWRQLLDLGVMQEGEPHLAATARDTVARMSGATATRYGLPTSGQVSIHGPSGAISVDLEIDDSMIDDVVWLPMNSEGSRVYRDLGVGYGDVVRVMSGGQL